MKMTFRWYGADDPVTLQKIRQIPVVAGIVSALYDVPVGAAWPLEKIVALKERVEGAGLRLEVIESIPVHEDIKLGRPERERWVDHYMQSIENMGRAGIPVLCYNFMPVFDWTRTDLALRMADGSDTLSYRDAALREIDLSRGTGELPGWAAAYTAGELNRLLEAYKAVDGERLWDNLAWFLERVVPVAEKSGVKMAIHPDDPPWSIFGLPRIITNEENINRLLSLVDSPANGITFCTGSLGPLPENDLPGMVRRIGGRGRIHFAHCRNIRRVGARDFYETAHPGAAGDVDMAAVLEAYGETGFRGPMRPDHGRMIWGEAGRPGYGLYDRALGAMYLYGLWEGCSGERKKG